MKGLLAFTRLTGDLVRAIRACPQPVIAAVDGVCGGAGAMIALAADLRIATPPPAPRFSSLASVWPAATWAPARYSPRRRPGPRRRAPHDRSQPVGRRGRALGTFRSHRAGDALDARRSAGRVSRRPDVWLMMTKTMLNQEWSMTVDQAIEAEAQAQAICMKTEDFKRAYDAFVEQTQAVVFGRLRWQSADAARAERPRRHVHAR